MKKVVLFSACFLTLGGMGVGPGEARQKDLQRLMASKLKNSQALLEGLAMSNFRQNRPQRGRAPPH